METLAQYTKWAGAALIAAAVLFVLAFFAHGPDNDPASILSPSAFPAHFMQLTGYALMTFGWPAMHLMQAKRDDGFSLVAVILIFMSCIALVGMAFHETYYLPIIAHDAPAIIPKLRDGLTILTNIVTTMALSGLFLFSCNALFRKSLPLYASLPIAVGSFMAALGFVAVPGPLAIIGMLLFAAGQVATGAYAWTKNSTAKPAAYPDLTSLRKTP